MNKKFFKIGMALFTGAMLVASCNKDNNGPDKPEEVQPTGKYVLLTAESGSGSAGYYAAYSELPTGEVDNIGGYSLQARAYGGFRHYKNWIFNRATLSGETGVVRYGLNASGVLEQSGFIKCGTSAQHVVVDETTGYYFDADRGKTKIQTFNPTTMQRTGEIDVSPLIETGDGISTNVFVGNQTLAAKEGKLYANITYSRTGGGGHNDNTRNYTLAVIDIAIGTPEKTIVHDFVKNQGHSPSEFAAWTQAKDGTLYFVTTGWDSDATGVMVPQSPAIFRIKAGETDFDRNWKLLPTDLGMPEGAQLWSVRELNGELYVDVSEEAIELPSYGNLTKKMYRIYAVNTASNTATRITGVPLTVFGHSTGNLEVVDNTVFIRVIDTDNGFNGYYQVDAATHSASAAFSVSRGGQAKGFTRLAGE